MLCQQLPWKQPQQQPTQTDRQKLSLGCIPASCLAGLQLILVLPAQAVLHLCLCLHMKAVLPHKHMPCLPRPCPAAAGSPAHRPGRCAQRPRPSAALTPSLHAQVQKLPGHCASASSASALLSLSCGLHISQGAALQHLSPLSAGSAWSDTHDHWPARPEPHYKAAGQLSSLQALANPAWVSKTFRMAS